MIKDEMSKLVAFVVSNEQYLDHNSKLFDVLEGDLLKYIKEDLKSELSLNSFYQVEPRIPPINVLKRIIDKLSKIYQQPIKRLVIDGSDKDEDLLHYYVKNMQANLNMNISNELFNTYKSSLLQPFVHQGIPRLRAIPNDRFLVYSNDTIDPQNPTHVILIQGSEIDEEGTNVLILHVYTDDEFLIIDTKGNIRYDLMPEENKEGVNPFGKIPFVYINRSNNLIMPKIDTDTFRMTKLIPVLLSDLNYAVKYQSFSIIYGIDIDDQNINHEPSAIWLFKSDPDSDKTPTLGSIKPQVDITQVLGLIQAEFSFWLNTRGIRPGQVGQITAGDQFSSGISKMIDEMDTSEDRQSQTSYYRKAEEDLWDLVMHYMHPYWSSRGMIENRALFTPTAKVEAVFVEQKPLVRRGELVKDLVAEVEGGFTSKKRAVATLNAHLSDDEIDELMKEIEGEVGLTISLPEEEQMSSGSTTMQKDHVHEFEIDMQGNGRTSVVNGHSHSIVNKEIQASEDHVHQLL